LDLERVRHAARLAFEGIRLKDIGRDLRVDAKTLWRWQQLPEWEETTAELAGQVRRQVVPLAHQVVVQALRVDLGHRGSRPDPKLALEVLDRFDRAAMRDDENGIGRVSQVRHIVELPMMDQGLESKSPTQLLLPTPPPAAAVRSGRHTTESPKRRRVVGPDE